MVIKQKTLTKPPYIRQRASTCLSMSGRLPPTAEGPPERAGSRNRKNSTERMRPGSPTIKKVACHGISSPTHGSVMEPPDLAQVSTPAPSSEAKPAPTESAMV